MKRHLTSATSARGFTIIELLTVVAVIAVIAAILFPAIASARKDAQARVCTSNLHQLGTGIEMYAADWDGGMPFAPDPLLKKAIGNSTSDSSPVIRLTAEIPYDVRALLAPYGCVPEVYRCPLDRWTPYTPGHEPTYFKECGSSYWYDAFHVLMGLNLADYATPAENVMMSDYTISHLDDDANTKGVNVLFADFHIKIYTWTERSALITAQGEP